MKIAKILLTSLAVSTATLSSVAYADFDQDDRIEATVRNDASFQANADKAVKILEQKGYTVKKIEADTYKKSRFGKPQPALKAEAYKGHVEYDVKFSYPDLRIVSERVETNILIFYKKKHT